MADYAQDTINKYGSGLSNFLSTLQPRRTALNAGQKAEESDYLSRFRQAIMGQEGLPHMYQRIGDELNIPNLRTAATNLQNTLTNLPETYSKATRGFDVNANQLNRIVGTKSAALAPAVETATNAYESAQDIQGQMIAANQAEQQRLLQPYQTEQSMMVDRFAREQSGFTTDNQMELNGYTTKLQAGITLTEGEKQRANELLKLEKQFNYSKQLAEQQFGFTKQLKEMDPWGIL